MLKNKVTINILERDYYLHTDDDTDYALTLGAEVDARLRSLVDSANLSQYQAAVIAALEYADEAKKAAAREKELLAQVEKLQAKAARQGGKKA
ncbi:MAG: cell division protein ZapA [Clostridia bacterium]|nr:cell division protein ZapA [Clostridia bacterium]MCR5690557.1 cell division protein ZapA [Clostridiales bacterium]